MAANVNVAVKLSVTFDGDLAGTQEYDIARVTDALVKIEQVFVPADTYAVLERPTFGIQNAGKHTRGVIILKPADYTGTLLLKTSDAHDDSVALRLHPTNPDYISISDEDVAEWSTFLIKSVGADVLLQVMWV